MLGEGEAPTTVSRAARGLAMGSRRARETLLRVVHESPTHRARRERGADPRARVRARRRVAADGDAVVGTEGRARREASSPV
jgi:hypothetical protein